MLQVEEHDSGTESDDEAPRSHGESFTPLLCSVALSSPRDIINTSLVSTYPYLPNAGTLSKYGLAVQRILFIHVLSRRLLQITMELTSYIACVGKQGCH